MELPHVQTVWRSVLNQPDQKADFERIEATISKAIAEAVANGEISISVHVDKGYHAVRVAMFHKLQKLGFVVNWGIIGQMYDIEWGNVSPDWTVFKPIPDKRENGSSFIR